MPAKGSESRNNYTMLFYVILSLCCITIPSCYYANSVILVVRFKIQDIFDPWSRHIIIERSVDTDRVRET